MALKRLEVFAFIINQIFVLRVKLIMRLTRKNAVLSL